MAESANRYFGAIAALDIMGFASLAKSSDADAAAEWMVQGFATALNFKDPVIENMYRACLHGSGSDARTPENVELISFSDTCIIFCGNREKSEPKMKASLVAASYAAMTFAHYLQKGTADFRGLAVRGGIEIGDYSVVSSQLSIFVGRGVLDALGLEKKIEGPFIAFSDEATKLYRNTPGTLDGILEDVPVRLKKGDKEDKDATIPPSRCVVSPHKEVWQDSARTRYESILQGARSGIIEELHSFYRFIDASRQSPA